MKDEALSALRPEEAPWAVIVESAPDAVYAVAPNGTIQTWNRAAERLYGYPAAAIVGRPLLVLVPPERHAETLQLRQRLQRGEPIAAYETEHLHQTGAQLLITLDATPLTAPEGSLAGAVLFARGLDVHQRRHADRLRALAEAALTITTSLSVARPLETTLPMIADLAGAVIDADACRLLLDGQTPAGQAFAPQLEVPIVGRDGRILGHLQLAGKRGGAFTAEDRELGVLFAQMASAAIENEGLYHDMQQADYRKVQFLNHLGHELRNPLEPIRNALHLLRICGDDPAMFREACAIAERQVKQLSRLVDDLLDVSRISHGKVRLRQEEFDLVPVLRDAAADYRSAITAAGLTLDVRLPPRPVWIQGDATRLTQVLGNLLVNAIKFTDPGGRIEVELFAEPEQRKVLLRVRDSGIGIEPSLLPRLFETFAQGVHSLDRSRGGLGLGLPLVKGLVELHGGEVEALSAGIGQGTTFTIWLPTIQPPTPLEERPVAAPAVRRHLRILVVEDNRDTAKTLQILFELSGHEVALAFSGPEGVEAARRDPPDIVFCDLGLPGLDGFAVATELRGHPETASARLVALSGYGQDEDRRRAHEAGFDVHLTKPVNPEELHDILADWPEDARS